MLGGIVGRRRRGRKRMRWLDGITHLIYVTLSELRELVIDREAWCAVIHGVAKSWTQLINWTELMYDPINIFLISGGLFSVRYFPGVSDSKSVCLQCGRPGFSPWVRKISWRRKWQSTPVFLPGKSHGRRKLVGYSPSGHKESDTTEWPDIIFCRSFPFFMFSP